MYGIRWVGAWHWVCYTLSMAVFARSQDLRLGSCRHARLADGIAVVRQVAIADSLSTRLIFFMPNVNGFVAQKVRLRTSHIRKQ